MIERGHSKGSVFIFTFYFFAWLSCGLTLLQAYSSLLSEARLWKANYFINTAVHLISSLKYFQITEPWGVEISKRVTLHLSTAPCIAEMMLVPLHI